MDCQDDNVTSGTDVSNGMLLDQVLLELFFVHLILEGNPESLPTLTFDFGSPLILGRLFKSTMIQVHKSIGKIHHFAGLSHVQDTQTHDHAQDTDGVSLKETDILGCPAKDMTDC